MAMRLRLRGFLSRLRGLVTPVPADDLDDELNEHLRLLEDDFVAGGMSPAEARHAAARALGGLATTRHAVQAQWTWLPIQQRLQDLRWTTRSLLGAPAFTCASVLTLALAISGVVAVLSIAMGTLYRPLPYPNSERIVTLAAGGRTYFTGAEYHALSDRLRPIAAIAVDSGQHGYNLVTGGRATYVTGRRVSPEWFAVLGMPALLGRPLTSASDRPSDAVVVLSHQLWLQQFGGDSDVIGTFVTLGDRAFRVVGVMPPSFKVVPDADLFTPSSVSPSDAGRNHLVMARLRQDLAWSAAASELRAQTRQVATELRWPAALVQQVQWVPYREALGLAYRPLIGLIAAAVAVLLALATLNVASLALVRASVRAPELATRAAIGGSPGRLLLEAATESLVLSSTGGVLGLLAFLLIRPHLAGLLPAMLGRELPVDGRVLLAVAAAIALMAGGIGLLPALRVRTIDLRTAVGLQAGRTTVSKATLRWRRGFAAAQLALAVTLLICASLLGRTLLQYSRVDLGFAPEQLTIGTMSLSGVPQPAGMTVPAFVDRTLERVRQVPGVLGASVTSGVPVSRALNLPLTPPAGAQIADVRSVDWRYVAPGFFETLGIRILDGRGFDRRDVRGGQPVAIVNAAFATAYFGREPALGRVLRLPAEDDALQDATIIAVVNDVKAASGAGWARGGNALSNPSTPSVFVPLAQAPEPLVHNMDVQWVVRFRGASAEAERAILDIVASAEPRLPFVRFQTMEEIVADQLMAQRLLFVVAAAFGLTALVIAAVGTYGVMAYSVAGRSRELGIRMALGASRAAVMRLVFVEGGAIVAVGTTAGLLAAIGASAALRSFIFGVAPVDGVSFVGTPLLIGAIALIAVALPAAQAARLRTADMLRST